MARSLATGRNFLIGLIAPDLLHPLFAAVAKALSFVWSDRGDSLIISFEEDPKLEARDIQQLMARLDGVVIAPSGSDVSVFERLMRNGVPYVLIDRDLFGISANFVGADDEAAARITTGYLIETGCRAQTHIRG